MLSDQFLVVISYHYLVVGLEKNMNLIHVIFQVSNGIYLYVNESQCTWDIYCNPLSFQYWISMVYGAESTTITHSSCQPQ